MLEEIKLGDKRMEFRIVLRYMGLSLFIAGAVIAIFLSLPSRYETTLMLLGIGVGLFSDRSK